MEEYYKKRLESFEQYIDALSREELEICKKINHILDTGIGVMSHDIRISDLEEDKDYVVQLNGIIELGTYSKNVGMFLISGKTLFVSPSEIDSIYS